MKNRRFYIFRVLSFAVVIFTALLFYSCGEDTNVSPGRVLLEMTKNAGRLPFGVVYSTESSPGSPDFLSESVLQSVFGEGECPEVMKRLNGAAIRLSSGFSASEFAFFICHSKNDAYEVADLCIKRIDRILYFARSTGGRYLGESDMSEIEGAYVEIVGNCVFMAVCSDGRGAVERGKSVI